MFGHHNINVSMVLFIVVLSAMLQCNGIGNAFRVQVIPTIAKEFETEFVEVRCLAYYTKNDHVITIAIGKLGKEILATVTANGAGINPHLDKDRFQAEGSIQQSLRLKIYNPKPSDSGLYECHVFLEGSSNVGEEKVYGFVAVQEMKIKCKAGYTPWRKDKKCIKIYDKIKPLSFPKAKSFCESTDNGRLVEINNLVKQNFISNLTMKPESYWTGAKRVEHFFYPSGGFMNGTLFRWREGNPNNYLDKQDCLELVAKYKNTKGVLTDLQCNIKRGFFCEASASYTDGKAICPNGQHLYEPERICITIHTNQLPYSKASAYCARSYGRKLLELKDRDMQDFVTGLPLNGLKYWIGAERLYSFTTLDGTPLAPNIRWLKGQPNNSGGEQDCLEFVSNTGGVLNDHSCTMRRYVICETDAFTSYE